MNHVVTRYDLQRKRVREVPRIIRLQKVTQISKSHNICHHSMHSYRKNSSQQGGMRGIASPLPKCWGMHPHPPAVDARGVATPGKWPSKGGFWLHAKHLPVHSSDSDTDTYLIDGTRLLTDNRYDSVVLLWPSLLCGVLWKFFVIKCMVCRSLVLYRIL